MFPKYEHRNTPIYISHRKTLDPCPVRFHSHMEALLLTKGRARVTVGSAAYDLQAGDMYLVFPNVPHGIESSDSSAVVLIADPARLPSYQDLLKSHLPQCPVLRQGEYPPLYRQFSGGCRNWLTKPRPINRICSPVIPVHYWENCWV